MPCGSPGRQLWPVGLFCSPWPEQALRANIHCQISLALNRIYTEWYPSKGYTFNITNSTSYDQYYVHGRTVFDVMVRITDDIFNTYLRKRGTVNPYYSEYCDGKSVTCPGLKQWGTVTLANNGRSALQILRYYYGSDIEIVRTSNIQSIPQSYPGSPLRQGDSGTAVFTLQRQLNRITKDYPFLGKLTVDGVFGSRMAATVRAFQKQFNLTADGVVGRQTWYKISYIYVSVKDLAELTSEGETSTGTLSNGTWNGTVLSTGASGSAVEQVQFWLNTLAQYDSAIPSVKVDGVFGTATAKDHIYNTPRAWYMYRQLNPVEAADSTPESDDIPWCLEPEHAVTVEDVDFLLGSHFEGTPYDPYGTQGTEESRHRYRPIGINRTGHMVAMQIRPYAPAESRSIMWISYGSGAFTTSAPFYANVDDTPAYLRDTTPEVSTDCLYWTNRLIATLADAHFYETSNAVEGFSEDVRSFGHRLVERTDDALAIGGSATGAGGAGSGAGSAVGGSGSMSGAAVDSGSDGLASPTSVPARLAAANDEMAEYLRSRNTKLLGDVLYTSSNLMHNSFAMSDRWN